MYLLAFSNDASNTDAYYDDADEKRKMAVDVRLSRTELDVTYGALQVPEVDSPYADHDEKAKSGNRHCHELHLLAEESIHYASYRLAQHYDGECSIPLWNVQGTELR